MTAMPFLLCEQRFVISDGRDFQHKCSCAKLNYFLTIKLFADHETLPIAKVLLPVGIVLNLWTLSVKLHFVFVKSNVSRYQLSEYQ